MNPWIIVGFLVALGAAGTGGYFFGHSNGTTAEREAWEKRENTELQAANQKIHDLEEAARTSERAHAVAVAAIGIQHAKEIEDARKQKERDVADARSGALSLRIATPCKGASLRLGSPAAAAPSVGDGAETVELPREITADLFAFADDADEVARQLTACQAVILDDRKTQ